MGECSETGSVIRFSSYIRMVEKWMNLRIGYSFNCSSVLSSGTT